MTLQQLIKLMQDVENGVEGQMIGFHLHQPIKELTERTYGRNKKFSEILQDFERHE